MRQSVLTKYLYGTGIILALASWGIIQSLALLNWQLWRDAPNLFPVLKPYDSASVVGDVILIVVASAYLISRANKISSREWWIGFVSMQIPYIYLKSAGIYYDQTQYLIAAAEGRKVCCGAAMGHLMLILYSLGPAAGLSWAAVGTSRWLGKVR